MMSICRVTARILNDIGSCEGDGDMDGAAKLLQEYRGQAMFLPRGVVKKIGIPYPDSTPAELFRACKFDERNRFLSHEVVEAFASIGYPNPDEGQAFNLMLLQIPRDTLSIAGMSVFLRELSMHHATLREGLIHFNLWPDGFLHYSVHFMGSFRKLATTDHAEVPVISTDAGYRMLTKRRQDPDDLLMNEIYAIVRRNLRS